MKRKIPSFLLALLCLSAFPFTAWAAETDCDAVYCFQPADFSESENFAGICVTGLPEMGSIMLGNRIIRPGDILTAEQTSLLTYTPVRSEDDSVAQLTYLPIFSDRVDAMTTMAISVFGKKDQAPIAEDSAMETYKNLPNEGLLKVSDPEGQKLTFTITRQPKRGTVTIREDGSFLYEPQKNKVGTDSFIYTATDPAGNVSREARVTITIVKPTDATQYTDTVGSQYRFAAEWMKNTGLFVGEKIGGEFCFNENRPVSRGEFVTMALQVLGIPVDENVTFTGYTDTIPNWLKPYLAAAMRSGMTANLPASQTFGAEEAITGAEAAVMLQNALDLTVSAAALENPAEDTPDWAVSAVAAMSESGIHVSVSETMTRGEVAQLLYQVSKLVDSAPGLRMYQ